MTLIEIHKYRFPSCLLSALINGDPIENNEPILPNGETEQDCLDNFIDRLEVLKTKYNATSYTIEYESESYFSYTNCLFNLGCDVTDIKINFFK